MNNSAPPPAAGDFMVMGLRNGWCLQYQDEVGAMGLQEREDAVYRQARIKWLLRRLRLWEHAKNLGFVGR